MKRINAIAWVSMVLLLVVSGPSYAGVSDPAGDNVGPVDLTAVDFKAAEALLYTRADGVRLLKISIQATPHLPAIIVFECNVDNAGDLSPLAESFEPPRAPCPCKTASGIDVGVIIFTRTQGDDAQTSFCPGCQNQQTYTRGRKAGEWYAYASAYGLGNGLGVIRGFLDPLPSAPDSGKTSDCYTLPWEYILQYAYDALAGDPRQFNWEQALNPVHNKWMISVWHDAGFADQDDFGDGTTSLNISDWAPNGSGVMADMEDASYSIWTYCEGNFDGDLDIDGTDAARFKTDFGRSNFFMMCPRCTPNY